MASSAFTLGFQDIDQTQIDAVGGKGANLGELSRIDGIRVPDGFCVTVYAYKSITQNNPELNSLLEELTRIQPADRQKISALSAAIRKIIEDTAIPGNIQDDIIRQLSRLGEKEAYAVRSSATAEDLPTASFAGQQDTYLNITGAAAILEHISKCWASLFTDRAIIYRMQNGFDHRAVQLAVVVQKMVFPQAAGILFTADPVTSNRKIVSIDASFGLGEALVSGLVNADNYKVRDGQIIDRKVPPKKLAIYASADGGTTEREIAPEWQHRQALTDGQILQLEHIGRQIEAYFGCPQDIEWCLADDSFYMVQSRPITTLYPIPEVGDGENHVYISVGHQQMMTDALKPLGISIWQLTAGRPMHTAGGRLFVDVSRELASTAGRNMLINVLGKNDPLIKNALMTILDREDFIPLEAESPAPAEGPALKNFQQLNEYDPAIVPELIYCSEATITALKHDIQARSGTSLLDFILDDLQASRIKADPQSFGVIMTGMNAAAWVNEKMQEWLGEKNAADILSQSVPHNITSEMGLALLDVADAIRPYPQVVEYLLQVKNGHFLDKLPQLPGGQEARNAIQSFLDKYGMRCPGEIDITKTRWSENPAALLPIILSNTRNFEPDAGKRKFGQGLQDALEKEQDLLARLRLLPDGEQKAEETRKMIGLIRNLSGYREYPKYDIVRRYFVYKQALLKEAGQLVLAGVIRKKEDIYYLSFEELRKVIGTRQLDQQIISRRKDEYKRYAKLRPPRVITSDGEIISGQYTREDIPAGALTGLAVSSGIIEGRARVILNMNDADLGDDDILVTAFTDPSWTPLFVSIKGLVTEVGGLMTHGAVIAREYGLPAVVGVENATALIKDGQRIRVNGTDGYVEVL